MSLLMNARNCFRGIFGEHCLSLLVSRGLRIYEGAIIERNIGVAISDYEGRHVRLYKYCKTKDAMVQEL
ncbi:MAG: hypothetical protein QXK88_07820 [Desulfurococcaceae archaeon]